MSSFIRGPRSRGFEDIEGPSTIRSRRLFESPLNQEPVIRDIYNVISWESGRIEPLMEDSVSERLKEAMECGATIEEIIDISPNEALAVLKDYTVAKVGSFQLDEEDVLLAFNDRGILARGSNERIEKDWKLNWEEFIKKQMDQHRFKRKTNIKWQEKVTLAAYVVNIKDAARCGKDGLLPTLVKRSEMKGRKADEVWDFPSVRAVIEYKWTEWAEFHIKIEFILYLGWLIFFVVYMFIYISDDLENEPENNREWASWTFAHISDVLAVLFMLPFILIEVNTIAYYKFGWLQLWNIIDSAAYFLQGVVTIAHWRNKPDDHGIYGTEVYNTILAIQCILLALKVQYFVRVFRKGISFVELLAHVIYSVRYFFFFILTMMVAIALSFSSLYKNAAEKASADDAINDFSGFGRSLVTSYAVLLGDFDSAYVFNQKEDCAPFDVSAFEKNKRFAEVVLTFANATGNELRNCTDVSGDESINVVKALFILLFQVFMSITVLNLLIAVVTEIYSTIMQDRENSFNMSRAQVIDELEISLSNVRQPKFKAYCHFLVVDRSEKESSPKLAEELSPVSTLEQQQMALTQEVLKLATSVQELKTMMAHLVQRLEQGHEQVTRTIV